MGRVPEVTEARRKRNVLSCLTIVGCLFGTCVGVVVVVVDVVVVVVVVEVEVKVEVEVVVVVVVVVVFRDAHESPTRFL